MKIGADGDMKYLIERREFMHFLSRRNANLVANFTRDLPSNSRRVSTIAGLAHAEFYSPMAKTLSITTHH
jgi:hypothetical protein